MKPKFLYFFNLLLTGIFVFSAAVPLRAQTNDNVVFPPSEKLESDIAAFVQPYLQMQDLSLRGPSGAFIALTPVTGNEFFHRHLYAKVTFVKDENQKVARLDWMDANGNIYPCKK